MDQNVLWNLYEYELEVFGKWYLVLSFLIFAIVFGTALLTSGASTLVPAYLVLYFT